MTKIAGHLRAVLRSRPPSEPADLPRRRVAVFVTVGTELPFDRLIGVIDEWARRTGRGCEVFAQIGRTAHPPAHIRWAESVDSRTFRQLISEAEVIVAHAGMGSILTALEEGRNLVVVPRRADLGEHRNDHQLATVAYLAANGLVNVATDEGALIAYLDGEAGFTAPPPIGAAADASLIEAVRLAIHSA